MFQKVMSLIAGAVDVAPPKDVMSFPMKAAESAIQGAVYKIASGRLTLATGSDSDTAVVCLENATGQADTTDGDPTVWVRGSFVAPGAVYRVPMLKKNGTAITKASEVHATFVIGARVNIDDTGLGVDAATGAAAQGPLTVLRVDMTNFQCWVVFNTCLLALNIDTVESESD